MVKMSSKKLNKTKGILFPAPLILFGFLLILGSFACSEEAEKPNQKAESKLKMIKDGAELPEFAFTNQDSQSVTKATVAGKIHVMDFFFTSCPTICPVMKSNMLTVYEAFEQEKGFVMVSHSIDTRHDSVPVLKDYAERLEVKVPLWHFVTGDKIEIMDIARDYMVSALEDSTAPGGYAHSGAIILFDKDRNLRGYYDGTSEKETQILIKDIQILLNE